MKLTSNQIYQITLRKSWREKRKQTLSLIRGFGLDLTDKDLDHFMLVLLPELAAKYKKALYMEEINRVKIELLTGILEKALLYDRDQIVDYIKKQIDMFTANKQ